MMKKHCQLLEKVPEINKYLKTSFLEVEDEDFKLLKLEKIVSSEYPLLIIMAGCHGEEPAPSLFLFQKFKSIAKQAILLKVNLVIYPLVNPYGFDRYVRDNRKNLNCNHNWIHLKKEPLAAEAETIKKDLLQYQPKIFISLHEDDLTQNEFYLFSFGNRKYEQLLLEAGSKHFPILKNFSVRDATSKKATVNVVNGAVHNDHDGSAEDFMSHQGVEFSCCTETPSRQPLLKRINCLSDLILKLLLVLKSA